jgi:hypothetical protein
MDQNANPNSDADSILNDSLEKEGPFLSQSNFPSWKADIVTGLWGWFYVRFGGAKAQADNPCG